MGIALNAVHMLARVLDQDYPIEQRKNLKVLTLGVQDCHFEYPALMQFLRRHGFACRDLKPENIRLNGGFYFSEILRKLYANNIHQVSLFDALGFSPENVESMDVMDAEDPTFVHDLNYPVPAELQNRYDIIFDGGTCEHIFSIRDSITNIIAMCRVGGSVVHAVPSDSINHGFVNFNAELFDTVYRVNGFNPLFQRYAFLPMLNRDMVSSYFIEFPVEAVSQFLQPFYTVIYFGVFRKHIAQPFRIPVQGELAKAGPEIIHSGQTGQRVGRWNRPGSFSGKLIALLDRSMILAFVLRGLYQLRRGRRITL